LADLLGVGAWSLGVSLEFAGRDRLSFEPDVEAVVFAIHCAFRTASERTIVGSTAGELRAAVGLESNFWTNS
jgi:hypothetical protein